MKKSLLILLTLYACCFHQQNLLAADPAPFKAVVTGSGPPMILIPGLASGGNVWDGTVAHFKDRYQCHVLTLAGFAGEPAMDGPFLEKVRDGIIKYIHEQKLDHPVIIGHSLGGMMAFWVAETAPTDVGPIISVDGVPFYAALMDPAATRESTLPMGEQLRSMNAALSADQFRDNNHQFLSMMITAPSNIDKVASLGDKSDPKAVGQAFFDLVTTDLRPNLKSIQARVLLIGSDALATDEATKAKMQRAYGDEIATVPHHKLVFAPTARHFIQLDDPEFFYRETEAFLKENPTAESKEYQGKPFQDSVYQGGPQKIPGRVQCAYYDLGGEGVAYHDTDAKNNGSGALNPADGTYLNEFRMKEGVDTSYTKFHDEIDNNPYDLAQPPEGQLYVGWTAPGEWFNMTVAVEQAGRYSIDLLYTSNRGGTISLDRNGAPLVPVVNIISTKNDKDSIAWRQWHHWNVMTNMAEVELPAGVSVLTLHIVTEGNMNLAYLDFKPSKP